MVGHVTELEPWHQYVESAGAKEEVMAPAVVKEESVASYAATSVQVAPQSSLTYTNKLSEYPLE